MISTRSIIKAREVMEGSGARVKRLFPHAEDDYYDPFVLLDEFFVDPSAGFPDHRHRGFEAVTYMKEGAFRHRDNIGNDVELGDGGVQRFTAGRGIVHAEMPGKGSLNHGFQLWVNLPQSLKSLEPSYQGVAAEKIPQTTKNGVTIKHIIGNNSPVSLKTDVIYQDIIFSTGSVHKVYVPQGFCAILYIYAGRVTVLEHDLTIGEAVELMSGAFISLEAVSKSAVLFLAGKPHHEPIVLNGSYVD